MLYIIGLGLCDAKDITLKGLEAIRACDEVFLDHYTSVLRCDTAALEALYGKQVRLADRQLVEQGAEQILAAAGAAADRHVAFLVVGDSLCATTHTDLALRARQRGIQVRFVHNASVLTAVGVSGLQLYRFGEVVSLPLWEDGWRPTSFLAKLEENLGRGLHTLCLLDIKVKEQSMANLAAGRSIFEPARYMSCAIGAGQLLDALPEGRGLLTADSLAVGCARLGADDELLRVDTLSALRDADLGAPLHSLLIVGRLHELEADYLKFFAVSDAARTAVDRKLAADEAAELECSSCAD